MQDGIKSGEVICDTEFKPVIIPDVSNCDSSIKNMYGDLVAGMEVPRNN